MEEGERMIYSFLSLSDLFKARDNYQALFDLGFWTEPELRELNAEIKNRQENPDSEKEVV